MFGRGRTRGRDAQPTSGGTGGSAARASRRHGRREPRSSITGPGLPNPDARITRFERQARGALDLLFAAFPADLQGVSVSFVSVPRELGDGDEPLFWTVDREARTILLYRLPIQRARGLHVDDDEHRRMFVEHCVYRAIAEYLDRDPWELLPGRFDHF